MPESAGSGSTPQVVQRLVENAAIDGVIVNDEQRTPASGAMAGAPAPPGCSCWPLSLRPTRAVKWKWLPSFSPALDPNAPPIKCTRREQMLSPGPSRPYLRVVDPSACVKASKMDD